MKALIFCTSANYGCVRCARAHLQRLRVQREFGLAGRLLSFANLFIHSSCSSHISHFISSISSIRPPIERSIHPSHTYIHTSTHPGHSIHPISSISSIPSIHLIHPIHTSVHLINPSIYLPVRPSIRPSIHPSIHPTHASIHPFHSIPCNSI